MNYQEQIAANKLRKEKEAEESFNKFVGLIADGVSPLVADGVLTLEQGSKVIRSVTHAFLNAAQARHD